MSHYHVIDLNRTEDIATVAFHFAVPSENNQPGTPLSTCLNERNNRGEGSFDSQVPSHATNFASENAEILAGTVLEHVESVQFDAKINNAAKLVVIEAKYTELATLAPDWLRKELKFWGYNGDVT